MKRPRTRTERSGPIEPLTPRVTDFIEKRLRGRSLDDEGDIEKRPDFECLNGLLVIEIKSLETPPSDRIENALATEKSDPKWPMFFGDWSTDKILKRFPNAEQINKKLVDRVGRTIVNHMKKA
ncbi:hypothetical protein, partial [Marivita sp.]|uniref:hypothetical protein n=1 Tax=Marivita sp. TaxID=2003365 RepID=UPI003F714691